MSTSNTVGPNCVQKTISELDNLKGQVKYVDRGCKIFSTASAVVGAAGVICDPLSKAATCAAGLSTAVGLFKTVGHVKDFVCPDEKTGKYNWQKGGKWGPLGTATNVLLTGADVLDPIFFLDKIGVFSLGVAATPLGIAKNTMLLGASTLGIIDTSIKLHQNDKALTMGTNKSNQRMEKWEARKTALREYREACEQTDQDQIDAKAKVIGELFAKQIKMLDDNLTPGAAPVDAKLKHKIEKWRLLLTGNKEIPAGANEAMQNEDRMKRVEDFCGKRVEQWTDFAKKVKENHYIQRTSHALGLTINICQFALGIIGLIGVILSLCSFGLAAVPILAIVGLVGWLATHILTLAKDLYCDYNKPSQLPNMKDLTWLSTAAAAA